jgi:hypothetical protein
MPVLEIYMCVLEIVLSECEIWYFALTEEHRLRGFENRALTGIFRHRKEEVTGGRKQLNNEELQNLYSSRNTFRAITSRGMRWAGHVARKGR